MRHAIDVGWIGFRYNSNMQGSFSICCRIQMADFWSVHIQYYDLRLQQFDEINMTF
jgi:hypothetical protein